MSRRFAALALAVGALLLPGTAQAAALFVEFSPNAAVPGDAVAARGPAPGDAGGGATQLFLFKAEEGPKPPTTVRDPRLIPIGPLAPRPDGLASEVSFVVPDDFPAGTYSQAVLCPRCGPVSFGRTFFALDPARATRNQTLEIGADTASVSAWWWIVGAVVVVAALLAWRYGKRRESG